MPGPAVGVMAGSALIGAISGNKARRDANRAARAQVNAAMYEADLQYEAFQKDLELRKEQWSWMKDEIKRYRSYYDKDREYLFGRRDRWETMADPLQEQLFEEAMRDPDYRSIQERVTADTAQQYGIQRDVAQRQMERYGVRPGEGVSADIEARLAQQAAATRIGETNREYRREEDRKWAQRVAALGTGINANEQRPYNIAQIGLTDVRNPTTGNLSRTYGDIAEREAGYASDAFNAAGRLGFQAIQMAFPNSYGVQTGYQPVPE